MKSLGAPESSSSQRAMRRVLSRRAFLGWAAVAGGGLLAACQQAVQQGAAPTGPVAQPTGSPKSGKLTVGLYAYVPQGIPFDQVVKNYVDKYPHIQVDVQLLSVDITRDSAAFVQRMSAEAQQKRSSYDIIAGPTTWIEVALLAKVQAIDPIEPYLPTGLLDDLYPAVKRGVTYSDGKIYSMPWWADVTGFMYRKSMLKEALGSDTPPATWDQVIDYSTKLKAKFPTKAPYGADWGFSHRLYLPILSTMTKEMYTSQGLWNTEGPAVTETLELIKKLVPLMPASAGEDLGSSKAFQAGNVAMATYWPTQVLRAIQAGQPADDIAMSANPKGKHAGTLFWHADVVIPKFASNKEEAGRFLKEALLSDFAVQKALDNWKIIPFKTVNERNKDRLPVWARPLVGELESGSPIPMNPYFLGFEQPIYKEEVEKMILKGQSVADTQRNLTARIREKFKEFGP